MWWLYYLINNSIYGCETSQFTILLWIYLISNDTIHYEIYINYEFLLSDYE